ncbi:MAG: magnesium transporter, partial [Deltaproteobacteria bacterium]
MEPKLQRLLETTRRLLRRGAYSNIARLLGKIHPADIAHLFRYLNDNEQNLLFGLIADPEVAGYVLAELDHAVSARLLQQLNKQQILELLQNMPNDDAADIVQNLPEELANEILGLMKAEDSEEIEELLQYEEDTAGGIMATEIFSLGQNLTVREAIQALQDAGDVEMVFYLYVTDEDNHLVGVL